MNITIFPVPGIGEIDSHSDLATLIPEAIHASGLTLEPGDVVVITSKIVSKAEGRVIAGHDREAAIRAETVRVVARRGHTTISQTHHGLVMAAAGVDASDVPLGQIALLPVDPDASARALRQAWGGQVAVIITDTFGRPWRDGLIDQAIGCAGLAAMRDHRGGVDSFGRPLQATVIAIADEIASASELVRGKSQGIPVAIVRGLAHLVTHDDGLGMRAAVRSGESDWFRMGHRDLISSRRTIRKFRTDPVPRALIDVAIAAALSAPAPHHTQPLRFVVVEEHADDLLAAMEKQWRIDLTADGLEGDAVDRRIARGAVLRDAPLLIAPFLVRTGAHHYGDARRSRAEERMFTLAGGAAIQNLMLALHGEGLGSAWVSSSIFCPDVVTDALALDPDWEPLGLIAVGYPVTMPEPRTPIDIAEFTRYL